MQIARLYTTGIHINQWYCFYVGKAIYSQNIFHQSSQTQDAAYFKKYAVG